MLAVALAALTLPAHAQQAMSTRVPFLCSSATAAEAIAASPPDTTQAVMRGTFASGDCVGFARPLQLILTTPEGDPVSDGNATYQVWRVASEPARFTVVRVQERPGA